MNRGPIRACLLWQPLKVGAEKPDNSFFTPPWFNRGGLAYSATKKRGFRSIPEAPFFGRFPATAIYKLIEIPLVYHRLLDRARIDRCGSFTPLSFLQNGMAFYLSKGTS